MRGGTDRDEAPVEHASPFGDARVSDVAVVIPTRNRAELAVRALHCVLRQTVLPSEVVVVDVGGRSWSPALQALADCAGPTKVQVVTLAEPSYAGRARNHGVLCASAAVLAFLDDDDRWEEGYLAQALAALEAEPRALVVTPLLVRRAGAVLALPPLPGSLSADAVAAHNPGVTGTNIVIRRSVLAQVGGFDEQLAAFNDLDLLVRLLDQGVPVVPTRLPLAEQLLHTSLQTSEPSLLRLAALARYESKHGHRMNRRQRRQLARERHWMQARLAHGNRARTSHRVAQLLLTSPPELARIAVRRWRLRVRHEHLPAAHP